MSTVSSSPNSTDPGSRRPVLNIQLPIHITPRPSSSDDDLVVASPFRPGISRHYPTLEEHALAVRGDALKAGSCDTTPRVENRREGFAWEVPKSEDALHMGPHHPPTPNTPQSVEEILRIHSSTEDDPYERRPSITSIDSVSPSRNSSISIHSGITRTDTGRSSFSGFARGIKKHAPDMRMFLPPKKVTSAQEDTTGRGNPRKGRTKLQAKFDLSNTAPIELLGMIKSKPAQASEEKSRNHSDSSSAPRITLPQNMLELPLRNRLPFTELSSIASSRPRSPKTPCIMPYPPVWHVGPTTAPPTIFEDGTPTQAPTNNPMEKDTTPQVDVTNSRPRSGRHRADRPMSHVRVCRSQSSSTSGVTGDSSGPTSPRVTSSPKDLHLGQQTELRFQEQDAQMQRDLQELGKRRSRRWRRSGPRSSNDLADTPPTSPSSFFTRLFKTKHSGDSTPSNTPNNATPKCPWRRKQSILSPSEQKQREDELIARMNLPPYFIPPGLNRVPTPPLLDAHGELKGHLNDFFFEMQGRRPHKSARASASIWDSDALLMSQEKDISSPATDSDESPQATSMPTPNLTAYLNIPGTAMSPAHDSPNFVGPDRNVPDNWYRIETSTGPDPANPALESRDAGKRTAALRLLEEKAKLEWITPEHLPNSPLCPLHAKYRGPRRGYCVFHRKEKDGGTGHEDSGKGWEGFGDDMKESGDRIKGRERGELRSKKDDKVVRKRSDFDGTEEGFMFVKSRRSRMKSLSSP